MDIQNSMPADKSDIVFLALDFDGVLHHRDIDIRRNDKFAGMTGMEIKEVIQGRFPQIIRDPREDASGALFDREVHLRRILAKCPNVRVIVSSSWRYSLTDIQLREVLSPAVATRVAGVLTRSERDGTESGDRGRRVESWLSENGLSKAQWVALDDDSHHFKWHQHRLVHTGYRGLDEKTAKQAVSLIQSLSPARVSTPRALLAHVCRVAVRLLCSCVARRVHGQRQDRSSGRALQAHAARQ